MAFADDCRVGPRKLAKIFSLCYHQWKHLQEDRIDSTPNSQHSATLPLLPTKSSDHNASPLSDRTIRGWDTPSPRPTEEENGAGVKACADFLLVDDNIINLKILGSFMQKLRLSYKTATDGKQAVDIVRGSARQFKCIFMDISMPVMNGFDASYNIRAQEKDAQLPRCPIIALTGLASAESQQEAFASGIDLFLSKPVKFKELSRILASRDLM